MERLPHVRPDPSVVLDGPPRRDLLMDHLAELLEAARVYVPDRVAAERLVEDLIREVIGADLPDATRPARVWLHERLFALARQRQVTPPVGRTLDPTDVRAALRLLPLADRAAVHLVDATACSYAEVASILGTDVTTAAQVLHRGRLTLAERLSLRPPVR